MKKRMISLFLALVMVIGVLPLNILAADADAPSSTLPAQAGEVLQEGGAQDTEQTPEVPAQPEQPEQTGAEKNEAPGEEPEQTTEELPQMQDAPAAKSGVSLFAVEDSYTLIETAADFAKMDASGKYRLANNITVTAPYKSAFKGEFDGANHTVTVDIAVTSGHAGLFAEIGSGANIHDVKIVGSVTSNVKSYGTGSLVGKVSGSATITNCESSATVSSTLSSGYLNYVGGLIGYSTSSLTLTNCSSSGAVSNSNTYYSAYTGGLISSVAGVLKASGCSASGNITAAKGYIGGFAARVSTKGCTFTNCNASGVITATDTSKAYGFLNDASVGNSTFTKCTYNKNNGNGYNNTTVSGLEAIDPNPNAEYTVTLTVVPETAKLTWVKEEQPISADGKYEFTVKAGTYTYSAVPQGEDALDYETKTGSITVRNKDVEQTISLEAKTYTLKFELPSDASDAKISVKNAGSTAQTVTNNTCTVPSGTYTYTVTGMNAYEDKTGSVKVNRADTTENVQLTKRKLTTVTFTYASDAANAKLTVKSGYVTVSPKSENVYELYAGKSYTWTFTSDNYAEASGTIDLTALAADEARTIAIPMTKIPSPVDGVYQLSTAEELVWFANEVNKSGSKLKNASVVLEKDIDLDGMAWTPIGIKSGYSTYAFSGSFDGNGHTIKNLNVIGNNSSGYFGLFGVVDGGTIQNLTVAGEVTVTADAAVGGIVGYFNGTSGVVENCINQVKVTGAQNVGGIAGQVYGGYSSSTTKAVRNCVNLAEIKSTGNCVGGLVGKVDGAIVIENCYNRGTIEGGGWKIGGIAAYISTTPVTLQNCYTTGKIIGNNEAAAIVGKSSSTKLNNLFYLESLTADSNATAISEADLKAVPEALQSAFQKAPAGKNDGYPVLNFEVKSYTVTITVSPEKAAVKIEGQTGTQVGAVWTFTLSEGTYEYTVSAEGYDTQTGSITVGEGQTNALTVTLKETEKPDGNAPAGKGTEEEPYLISSKENLIWLSTKVNGASTVTAIYAELTQDIDLGGEVWTPIGADFHEFSGSFDGKGYTISGLNVTGTENAGLFGVTKNAEISNLVVKGSVSGTSNAGGIVAKAKDTITLKNCGNEAAVTSGENAGGIIGNKFTSGSDYTVTNCYNTGNVTATGNTSYNRAGGIVGSFNGTANILNSYNAGTITSDSYAGGLIGGSGNAENCYNLGTVQGGSETKFGTLTNSAYSTFKNCYYLIGSATDRSGEATGMTLAQMQGDLLAKLGETNWKIVSGVNKSIPILAWQKAQAAEEPGSYTPAENVEFVTQDTVTLDDTGLPMDIVPMATSVLKWDAAQNAGGYVISIWRQAAQFQALSGDELAAFNAETDPQKKLNYFDEQIVIDKLTDSEQAVLAKLDDAVQAATQKADIHAAQAARAAFLCGKLAEKNLTPGYSALALQKTGELAVGLDVTQADCAALLETEGVYYAAVSVKDENGTYKLPTQEEVEQTIAGWQQPYNRLQAVQNLRWDGAVARWDAKSGFTADDAYLVYIYTTENGEYGNVTFQVLEGTATSLDCRNVFAVDKDYVFTVTAVPGLEYEIRTGLTDSWESAYSTIYSTSSSAGGEWVEISTPEQWMDLANIPDEFVIPGDQSSGSRQALEWSKNYKLTADLDFSTLTADYTGKTLSVGNVTNRFTGQLDGDGHKITGLSVSMGDSGLFNYVGATGKVSNLTIENANMNIGDNGALLVHNNYGTIENCALINCKINADTGSVIAPVASRNYGVIRECYVQGGSLTANGTRNTGHGGFVGANEKGGRISFCWTSMDVTSKGRYAGGFAGYGYGASGNQATITDCFALGNVTADSYSGGFLGRSVYENNVYTNCYAAGTVTTTGPNGNGFAGGNDPDSSFQYDQGGADSDDNQIVNCYFVSDTASEENFGAKPITSADAKLDAFVTKLGSGSWTRDESKNDGLPYLKSVKAPEKTTTSKITVTIALTKYDKQTYNFSQMGTDISVTMDSDGNTRVVDLMDAAQEQHLLSYGYTTSAEYGRYIHTINDYTVEAPDGWMFTINDKRSNYGASLATVKDGDRVLWYEGTTENGFIGPKWDERNAPAVTWTLIASVADLQALAQSTDDTVLAKNYRVTADLDLTGVSFGGIGSAEHPFTGIFDGQSKQIKNAAITGTQNVGFFNVIKGATIKNVQLVNVNVSGQTNVGGLVGASQAVLNKQDLSQNIAGLIGNCAVRGSVSGQTKVGGLVGLNGGQYDNDTGFSIASAVNSSSFTGTVAGTGDTIGGLVGANDGAITDSFAAGEVAAENCNVVGGLAGSNNAASSRIYRSHADVQVTGKENVGGFAGSSTGDVRDSYSLGNVTGSGYVGGFAGSISAAKTVASAGTVTVTGSSASGYAGGFAGSLGGTIVGIDSQIAVKNFYGNCEKADGTLFPPIGNMSKYTTSEAAKQVLENAKLETWPSVCEKMKALFDVTLVNPGTELSKYASTIIVPGTAEAGSVIDTLLSGQTLSNGCTAAFTTESEYLTGGASLKLQKKNETGSALQASVTVTVSDGRGHSASKTITVAIAKAEAQPEQPDQTETLAAQMMHTIAKASTTNEDPWMVMDMIAYAKLADSQARTYAGDAAAAALTALAQAPTSNAASDRAKIEIIMAALGKDTTALGSSKINNASALRGLNMADVPSYTAPYVLLADMQGNVQLTAAQKKTLITTLKTAAGDDGMFYYSTVYEGVTHTGIDADTAGATLAALWRFYQTDSDAKELVNKILANAGKYLDANGSFGNANTDAMMIIGLVAVGRDPYSVKNETTGKNLVQGLMSYANESHTKFQYYGEDNALATEQGFRALVALAKSKSGAYNIYDYSANRTPSSAELVEALIDAIGTVSESSGAQIRDARESYNNLTPAEKSQVSNLAKLEKAEQEYEKLLADHKSKLKQELRTEYDSYDESKYSQAARKKLQEAYNKGISRIDAATTCEAANAEFEEAVRAMKEVKAGDITVSFRLIGDTNHGSGAHDEYITWITTTEYSLAQNATVADLFSEAASDAGLRSVGLTSGYISTIYAPSVLGGYSLGEFDNGKNSGWMYTVNNTRAKVGIKEYTLKDGDKVVFYYVDDYTTSSSYPYAADISPETYVRDKLGKIVTCGAHGSVSPTLKLTDLGTDVTFTFKPDNGYRVKNVKVDGKDLGPIETYTYKNLTVSSRIVVEFTDGTLPFDDVRSSDWFYDDVVYVYNEGLFNGTSATRFSPNAPMTRAMLVTVLYRLEGQPSVTGRSGFADVVIGSYYEDAVTWAANNGVVNGTSASTFSPDALVTREQMAAILYRYAQAKKYSVTASSALTSFRDADSVSAYAVSAMQWAVAESLINGASGSLMPTGSATRAQVAAILHRFVTNVAGKK